MILRVLHLEVVIRVQLHVRLCMLVVERQKLRHYLSKHTKGKCKLNHLDIQRQSRVAKHNQQESKQSYLWYVKHEIASSHEDKFNVF